MQSQAESLLHLRTERLVAQSRGIVRAAARVFLLLAEWQERAEQRAHLANMDAAMLKDIGVSHADAWREAHKPFWRA